MSIVEKKFKINSPNSKLPTFRSDIHNSSSKNHSYEYVEKTSENLWENKNYKHVYHAMKKAREEIAESITNGELIFFDSKPLDFKESSVKKYMEDVDPDDGI